MAKRATLALSCTQTPEPGCRRLRGQEMRTSMGDRVRRRRTLYTTAAIALAVVLSSFPFAHGAPAAPVITSPTQGSLAPGGVPVRGTSAAGTTVEIFEGALSLGTVN